MKIFSIFNSRIDGFVNNSVLLKKADNWIAIKVKQWRFRQARSMADSLHKADGRRYIVIEVDDQFLVLNNRDRKILNKKAHPRHRVSFHQLLNNRSYMTP